MCEQADTFCRRTCTALAHLAHLKVSVRGAFNMVALCWTGKGGILTFRHRYRAWAAPAEGFRRCAGLWRHRPPLNLVRGAAPSPVRPAASPVRRGLAVPAAPPGPPP